MPSAASARSAAGIERSVEFWVQTTCASTGSKAPSRPSWSLSAITPRTPISGSNANESPIASTTASAPCGLWAASSTIVGLRRITSSRPGEVDLRERLTHDLGVQSVVATDERLDRGQCERGVLGLVRAVERQEHLVVRRAEPLQRQHLAAHRRHPGGHPELETLAGQRRAHLGAPLPQHQGHVLVLHGGHHGRAGLDDPGLLAGDLRGCRAQVLAHGRPRSA